MYIPNRAEDRLNAMISGDLRFCSGKSSPAPPDYASAAEATAAGNKEMLDAQTIANRPDQFSPFGSTTWEQDGDQWKQYTNLNPESQRALDAQLKLTGDKSELAGGMIGRLEDDFKDPMDFSQLPAWGDVPQAGDLRANELRTQAGVDPTTLTPEQLQRSVDFSGAEQRTSAEVARQNAEDAIYGRSTSRLDPQWEQRTGDKEAQLAAQGLRPGDPAYDRAMENLGRERTDAYQQAQYGSIMGGGEEASRTVGMQLAGREQDMGEALRSGDFANTAAGQAFGMAQQAGGQNFGQQLTSQGQAFSQDAAAGAQNFGQAAAAGAQNFGQQSSESQQQSQMRNAQLTEEMTKRGFSLNEINAIISGQQVQMPNQPGFNEAGYTAGADYSGAARDQYSGELDQFSADQAMMNSILAGASQGAMMMSDRRLKDNITRIGTFKRYPLYLFRYIWDKWAVGVMADEINQDAVIMLPNGYAAVDYRRIK